MVGRTWKKEEIKYLKKFFEKQSKEKILKNIDRTWSSIKTKASDLGLKRGGMYFWSEEEVLLLKEIYSKTPFKEIFSKFPLKSESTIRVKAISLGLKKETSSYNRSKPWTEKELLLLKEKYAASTSDELKELFPQRKLKALQVKASRLGIKRDKDAKNRCREKTNFREYGVRYISQSEKVKETIKKNSLQKYGVEHHTKSKEYKEKITEANITKWGMKTNLQLESNKEKVKETNLKLYGVENPQQNKDIQEKTKKTCQERYRVPYVLQNSEIREKGKITLKEKYGVEHNMKLDYVKDKIENTCLKKYGEKSYMHTDDFREKSKLTCQSKYGVQHYSQTAEYLDKIYRTKKLNGTHGKSKEEDVLFKHILEKFFIVERHYRDTEKYPFFCDFYIPKEKCFIEYQGHTLVHGTTPYTGTNLPEEWIKKAARSDHYKKSIKTYTESDPQKRRYASYNNLNFLEIWHSDLNKGWKWVDFLLQKQGLPLSYLPSVLQREFKNISEQKGDFSRSPNQNKIIKKFQVHFYRKERELWNHPKIREKLITNREKYKFKNKEELTNQEILQGFKISGAFIGYSFFSPLWIKAFIEKYNIQSIYDPCMGWGHRLLGAKDILYIGNDICPETYQGNKAISEYFSLENKYFYNFPAEEFVPNHEYDAVFTCPPYFNTEIYEGEETSTIKYPNYDDWINKWWRKVIQSSLIRNPKYFAFVINNKYKEDMKSICIQEGLTLIEEIPVGKNSLNHFQRKSSNIFKGEFLLIFH